MEPQTRDVASDIIPAERIEGMILQGEISDQQEKHIMTKSIQDRMPATRDPRAKA